MLSVITFAAIVNARKKSSSSESKPISSSDSSEVDGMFRRRRGPQSSRNVIDPTSKNGGGDDAVADRRSLLKIRRASMVDVVNAVQGIGRAMSIRRQGTQTSQSTKFNGLIRQISLEEAKQNPFNCWTEPSSDEFLVRGRTYLTDKKKVPSGYFLLEPCGIDFYMTPDECPSDIGRSPCAKGGTLQSSETPLLLVNFRLGFGVLVMYFDVPDKFVPFLRYKRQMQNGPVEECSGSEANGLPPTAQFSFAADHAFAEFLLGDDQKRNSMLKFIPQTVVAPILVRTLWKTRPAMIAKKVPTTYKYHSGEGENHLGEYLSIDFDICKSEFAQKILTMVRGSAAKMTLDVGFVIEGDTEDKLPEQMLGGVRICRLNLSEAPILPPFSNDN